MTLACRHYCGVAGDPAVRCNSYYTLGISSYTYRAKNREMTAPKQEVN